MSNIEKSKVFCVKSYSTLSALNSPFSILSPFTLPEAINLEFEFEYDNKSEVKFEIIDSKKRPVSAVADSVEVRNVNSVSVKQDSKNKVELLFDSQHSFEERILNEQFKF